MINPLILALGGASFLFAFFIHVLFWRIFRPEKQIFWLATIFLMLPTLIYGAIFLIKTPADMTSLISPFNLILSLIWHYALSAAYIMTYPPIQTGCPSLNIVLAVFRSGREGLSEGEIRNIFSTDSLLSGRIRDLKSDGLIDLKEGAWGLTFPGRFLRTFFSVYRRLLGLPAGEG
ncbi:MAG TPA: hypothetical protein ENH12_06435 [Proteobacteria bacterium]|nr:hypothetical protein [Pseudomonadota bacterium]